MGYGRHFPTRLSPATRRAAPSAIPVLTSCGTVSPLRRTTRARRSRSRSTRKSTPRPGRPPGRIGATPGNRPRTRTRRTRTRRRTAVAGLGVEADPGPEGDSDRLREEEGAAVEDRRMDAPASHGRLPVRPRTAAIYDPMTEPCPPTPRADAFARSAWAWCERRHLNRWTAGQRRKHEEIWYAEVTAAARRAKPDQS
jgi:hypothetical protein